MHDVVVVGIPLLAIFAGILFNRNDVKELRSEFRSEIGGLRGEFNGLRAEVSGLRTEMNARFSKVEDHLGRIDADLRQFYHLTGKLEARMDSFDKR